MVSTLLLVSQSLIPVTTFALDNNSLKNSNSNSSINYSSESPLSAPELVGVSNKSINQSNASIYSMETYLLSGVTANDAIDGDLTKDIIIENSTEFTNAWENGRNGTYTVTYSVTNSQNHTSIATSSITIFSDITVHYQDGSGNKLKDNIILSGNVGDTYIAETDNIFFDNIDYIFAMSEPELLTDKFGTENQPTDIWLTYVNNLQSINGSDYTMYVGDEKPTVDNFNASARDKDGNNIDVSADLSNIDFSKPGTYNVVLKSMDGQTKTVILTIKEKEISTAKVTFNAGKGGTLQGTNTINVPKGTKGIDLPKVVADKSNVEDIYFLDWYQNGKIVNPKNVAINSDTTFTAKFGAAVYRLYNKNNGDHLLTKNKDEKNKIAAKGWKIEINPKNEYGRAAFYVPVQADSAGKKQVYRIYNPNSGEHFYTTNKSEADAAVKKGWRQETDSNYTWVSEGDVKIYREFNPDSHTAGSHNFTTDIKEHQNVVKAGWKDESKDSSLWTVLKAGF